MLKQLKTFIMQILVFATLALPGLGVQAKPVSSAEPMQGQSLSAESEMDGGCAGSSSSADAAVGGESIASECDMNGGDCHSSCANCQAPNDGALVISRGESVLPVGSEVLVQISAQYPIDHPPRS